MSQRPEVSSVLSVGRLSHVVLVAEAGGELRQSLAELQCRYRRARRKINKEPIRSEDGHFWRIL